MISWKEVVRLWNNFFFTPQPVEGIALFRIIWVSVLSLYFIFDLGNAADFYGPHAIVSLATVREQFNYLHLNLFHSLTNSYESVYLLQAIYGVALVFALVGFYTRTSLVVTLICMVSFHQRNIWMLSSSEVLMRIVTIYLICSPAGNALSVDSLLGRRFPKFQKEKMWAPWALRMIQIQVSVVYLWTVWHKIKGETWFDGTATYYATRLVDLQNFPVPFLLDSMIFLKLITWGTLLIETALGVLVWIKECRKYVILTGIVFHLGIEYMMSIPFFEIIMMALILLYFTPEEMKLFVDNTLNKLSERVKGLTIIPSVKEKFIWIMRGK